MDEIKLKPCPFCGGKAEYIINSNYERCTTHGWQFGIKCTNCMIELPMRDFILNTLAVQHILEDKEDKDYDN